MSILIKDATIVTQNSERQIIEGNILIDGDCIRAVGKTKPEKSEFIIDAKGKIAIPGFVNMHTHVAMTGLRGLGEDLPLQRWLEEKIWPQEAKLTKKDIYEASMLGIREMLLSGITTFNDMYLNHCDEIAKAAETAGIRASLSRTVIGLPGRTAENELSEAKAFAKKWKGHKLVMPHIGAHSIYACDESLLLKAKELATGEKLKFHIHISETRREIFDCLDKTKKYPIEYLDSIGLLDEHALLAHASWVTKREIALAGKKKATIMNCPISNLKLATGGICPVREYHAAGTNVCIGTDGPVSNNSLNMFESIKLSSLLQKHHYWKADVLPAQAFLDFATINGARALGINAGSIEAGKLADIVLLDARMPNMQPYNDLISNLVYSAGPQNVTDVIVGGKQVVAGQLIHTKV